MNYFKKLEIVFPDIDMSRIVGGSLQEGYGDTLSYDLVDSEYFYNLYSTSIRFKIPPNIINYTEIKNRGALPHVDEAKSVINYYINTTNEVTIFWEVKDPAYKPNRSLKLEDSGELKESEIFIYERNNLKIAGHFIAQPLSTYVLKTTSIHSVIKPNIRSTRGFFRWMWMDLEFDQLLENIEVL